MTPLSKHQKAEIAQAARRAYDRWPEREAYELINSDMSRTACFEAWRHVEQGKACGIQSLCACTQAHYGKLLSHFLALAGDEAGAQRVRVRDEDNDRRVALFKLSQALRERGLGESYAVAICRRQYRCELAEASPKQIWRLLYTVRSRKKPLPKEPANGNPF